jgi:hypothetical protein
LPARSSVGENVRFRDRLLSNKFGLETKEEESAEQALASRFFECLEQKVELKKAAEERLKAEQARKALEREFNTLAEQWRSETAHLSLASEKANNFAYHQIMAMGEKVLPLILRELKNRPSDWFWALRAIARDKAPEIPPEAQGRVRRIAEIWLEWGKLHGHVSG